MMSKVQDIIVQVSPKVAENLHHLIAACIERELLDDSVIYGRDEDGAYLEWPQHGVHCFVDAETFTIDESTLPIRSTTCVTALETAEGLSGKLRKS